MDAMTAALRSTPAESTRDMLRDATVGALDALQGVMASKNVLDTRKHNVVSATIEDVRRMLDRAETTIALLGQRESAELLDAWLGSRLFDDADVRGAGPIIAVRVGESAGCRVSYRDGRTENVDSAVRKREAMPEPQALHERAAPAVPEEQLSFFGRIWRALARVLGALLGRPQTPALPSPPLPDVVPSPASSTPSDELARRLRELVDVRARGSEVSEVALTFPVPDLDKPITLLDLRGATDDGLDEMWSLVRREVDTCVLVLEGTSLSNVSESTRAIAKELSSLAPHFWVATRHSTAEVARALSIDPGRLVSVEPPIRSRDLCDRVLDERSLMAGVRAIAALRLAARGLDDVLEEDAKRDQIVLDRIASYHLPDAGRRRDETRHRVSGAVAGQGIRILQSVLGVLETELGALHEERMRAVTGARSVDEVKTEVGAVGHALRGLREKLAHHAESLAYEAMSRLGPLLLDDLERRVAAVREDLPELAQPTWAPAPKVSSLEEGLVAQATLSTGEALRADIRWADSFRSLDKIKQRCAQQLENDLSHIANAANAEILDFEPQVAKRIQEALEAWVEASGVAYTNWLDRAIEREQRARLAARTKRQAPLVAQRDRLAELAERIGELSQAVATQARTATA